jgi:hypothetical protein
MERGSREGRGGSNQGEEDEVGGLDHGVCARRDLESQRREVGGTLNKEAWREAAHATGETPSAPLSPEPMTCKPRQDAILQTIPVIAKVTESIHEYVIVTVFGIK